MTIERVEIDTDGQTYLHLKYEVIRPLGFFKMRKDDKEWKYYVLLEVDKEGKEDHIGMGSLPDTYGYSVYVDTLEEEYWMEDYDPVRIDIPRNKVYIGNVDEYICYGDNPKS